MQCTIDKLGRQTATLSQKEKFWKSRKMLTVGQLLGKNLIQVLNTKMQRSKDLKVSAAGKLSMNTKSVPVERSLRAGPRFNRLSTNLKQC